MNDYTLQSDTDGDVKLFVKRLDGTSRPMRAEEWTLERLKLGLKASEEPAVFIVNPAQPLHEAFEQASAEINELHSGNGSAQFLNRRTLVELHAKVVEGRVVASLGRQYIFDTSVPPQPLITYVQAQQVSVWVMEERMWSRATVVEVDQDKQLYKIQTDAGRPILVSFEMSGLIRPRRTP